MQLLPPFMGDFSDEDVAWFQANGVQLRVRSGEAIIHEGVHPEHLYFVLDGSFRATSREHSFPVIPNLGRGQVIGELSYINRQLPLSTVRAEVDSVVLAVPRDRLSAKIDADPGFGSRFHKVMSEFAANRLYHWGRTPEPDAGIDDDAYQRVSELIEQMLRGQFPAPPHPPDPPKPPRPDGPGREEPGDDPPRRGPRKDRPR